MTEREAERLAKDNTWENRGSLEFRHTCESQEDADLLTAAYHQCGWKATPSAENPLDLVLTPAHRSTRIGSTYG